MAENIPIGFAVARAKAQSVKRECAPTVPMFDDLRVRALIAIADISRVHHEDILPFD